MNNYYLNYLQFEVVLYANFGMDGMISDLFTKVQIDNTEVPVRQWKIYFTNKNIGKVILAVSKAMVSTY